MDKGRNDAFLMILITNILFNLQMDLVEFSHPLITQYLPIDKYDRIGNFINWNYFKSVDRNQKEPVDKRK